jgi:hypothetical protein
MHLFVAAVQLCCTKQFLTALPQNEDRINCILVSFHYHSIYNAHLFTVASVGRGSVADKFLAKVNSTSNVLTKSTGAAKKLSAGFTLKEQLRALIAVLVTTDNHFVRTLRPNPGRVVSHVISPTMELCQSVFTFEFLPANYFCNKALPHKNLCDSVSI